MGVGGGGQGEGGEGEGCVGCGGWGGVHLSVKVHQQGSVAVQTTRGQQQQLQLPLDRLHIAAAQSHHLTVVVAVVVVADTRGGAVRQRGVGQVGG